MSLSKNTPSSVHIGQQIQKVFEQQPIKLADFADELGTVRQNVYRIFKKKDVDTGLLTNISRVLNHNFFQYYCQHDASESLNDLRNKKLEEELTLANREIEYLKKIIALMEEKTALLQYVENIQFRKKDKVLGA